MLIPPYGIPSVPREGSLVYRAYRLAVRVGAILVRATGLGLLIRLLCLVGDRHYWSYDLTITWHFHFNDEWVFPLRRMKFEDTQFYGPADAHSLLSYQFGDYMRPPPENQRNQHGLGRILVTRSCGAPWSLDWNAR
jgi:lipopolysaccharide cholinephosphotransferase